MWAGLAGDGGTLQSHLGSPFILEQTGEAQFVQPPNPGKNTESEAMTMTTGDKFQMIL